MIVRGESTIINYHAPFDQGFRPLHHLMPSLVKVLWFYRALEVQLSANVFLQGVFSVLHIIRFPFAWKSLSNNSFSSVLVLSIFRGN